MSGRITEPKYQKPKILLVDLPKEAPHQLISAGFNVQAGTFGRPYRTNVTDHYLPVVDKAELPNYTEQEIIIIDLTLPEMAQGPPGTGTASGEELAWYAKGSRGVIYPRPRAMALVREDWGRSLRSGGAFVVFTQPPLSQELVLGVFRRHRFNQEGLPSNNWSFLYQLSGEYLTVRSDQGYESRVLPVRDCLDKFLRGHQQSLEFTTTLSPHFLKSHEFSFTPCMVNKYGEPVAGIIQAKREERPGCILILPQFKDKQRAVYELVINVLPELCPHLFPDFEGERWIHR